MRLVRLSGKRRVAAITAVLAVAAAPVGGPIDVAMASAGTEPDEPDELPAIDINAQPRDSLTSGGELRLAVDAFAENWNPLHADAGAAVSSVLAPLQYTLWHYDETGTPTPNPDYVDTIEVSNGAAPDERADDSDPADGTGPADGTVPADGSGAVDGAPCALPDDPFTVTYTLNSDATWNDGTPITVADFEANWSALSGVDERFEVASTAGYDRIGAVEAGSDEYEVVVAFCRPYGDYPALFDNLLAADAVADPEVFNEAWIGRIHDGWLSGPFVVRLHDSEHGTIELQRRDGYWGEPALLDSILFSVVAPDRRPQALANGQLDAFSLGADPNGYQLVTSTDGFAVRGASGRAFRQLTINTADGPLAEPAVRRAIAVALDRDAIAAADLAGLPVSPEVIGNRIAPLGSPLADENAPAPSGDVAGELLDEAGWELDGDGVRSRDGEELTVTFSRIAGVRASAIEADLVAEQLADIGFVVEVVDVALDDWLATVDAGGFELIAFTWVGTLLPYRAAPQLYASDAAGNYTFAELPEVDRLLDELATAVDEPARAAIANEIDVILWEEAVTIPLFRTPDLVAAPADLANWGAFGLARPVWRDVGYLG